MHVRAAAREGFINTISTQTITVLVFPSVREFYENGNYSPSVKVFIDENDSYAGSDYDKGGYILAAERVLSFTPFVYIIAEYKQDWEQAKNANFYAYEHALLKLNDEARFQATVDHSNGGGHPILD